jgi:sugar lactone lactonase YvrE
MNHVLVVLLLFTISFVSRAEEVDFESDRWTLQNGEIVEYLGRQALEGSAVLSDVMFENGVIEVDIAVKHERSYPGIQFRRQSDQDYEELYIRPHRSKFYPDVLQYTPVFNGISEWQLYSGDGFTAGATVPIDQWIHLRLEVLGTQARVLFDTTATPSLVINELQHGESSGAIALNAPPDGSAYFSNFRYETTNDLSFDPPPQSVPPYGMITKWELSQPFPASQIDLEKTPEAQELDGIAWQSVTSLPSGLVDIARYHGRTGRVADCVYAKATLHANEEEVKVLRFGYSDAISMFLNGSIVFSANSAYRQRDPSFLGIVGLNDEVYLPLKKGDNELILAVVELMGGWGFMCQDGKAVFQHDGLTKLWELPEKLRFPESAVYDPKRDRIYVTNFFNEGREFISKITSNGQIEEMEWITGLAMPSGLKIYQDTLYAIERGNMVKISIDAGKVIAKYPIPNAVFPNDIDFDTWGNAYISDSRGNMVHKFSNGTFEVWLCPDDVTDPNGICVDGERLFLGHSGDGSLKRIDLKTKEIETLASFGVGAIMDGLTHDGKGGCLASDYNGRLFRVGPSGEKTELLNTTAPGVSCADFCYVADRELLIIPTLYDNNLIAYRLEL